MPGRIQPKVFVAEYEARFLARRLAAAIRAALIGGHGEFHATLTPSDLPKNNPGGWELEPADQILKQAVAFTKDALAVDGIQIREREVHVSPTREGHVAFYISGSVPPLVSGSQVSFQRAVPLEKKHADELHARITKALGQQTNRRLRNFTEPNVVLRGGNTTHVNEVWGVPRLGMFYMTYNRLDDLFCMDNEAFGKLPDELRRDLGGNVLRFPSLNESMLARSFGAHTTTGMLCAGRLNLEGKRWIGCGAGDGAMELMGAKRGATSLDLIDYEPIYLAAACNLLTLNGLQEGKDFRLVRGDLTNPEALAARLEGTKEQEAVVVTTIGQLKGKPHREYTITNAESIEFASALQKQLGMPRIAAFMGSGYLVEFTGGNALHPGETEVRDQMREVEERLGLVVRPDSYASCIRAGLPQGPFAFAGTLEPSAAR